MNKKQKKVLLRIIIAFLLFILAHFVPHIEYIRVLSFLIPYILIGYDVILKACRNIFSGYFLDENFLMSIATCGALLIGEYSEAIAVMLFYQVGELFQSIAVAKSRRSISELMDIRPDYANVIIDGKLSQVDPSLVKIGDIIVVSPGERIALDGRIADGKCSIDTSSITGESLPREVSEGDAVNSGCICLDGTIRIIAENTFENSTVSKILELVENASEKKSKQENFISRFSMYYTPIVVGCAALLAILLPIAFKIPFLESIHRSLSFLVVSCPCALVISVPLSFFGGLGCAAKKGILIKGSNYLELASKLETIVFDKTGTLTTGKFSVIKTIPHNIDEEELISYAAHAEYYSSHPIATSIKDKYGEQININRIKEFKNVAGIGVIAKIDDDEIKIHKSYSYHQNSGEIAIDVVRNDDLIGTFILSDTIKETALTLKKELSDMNVKRLCMLSGDTEENAKQTATKLNFDAYSGGLLPQDKLNEIEKIMKQNNGPVGFVGDGINDAPVIMRADIGFAMGCLGSDASIEAADIVIMNDDLKKISKLIGISKRTMAIVKQNIIFAIAVKMLVLILSAIGLTSMWLAVFADVGVAIIAILNSMRTLKLKK